ncbi:MAG TPA: GlsB/YeaQ/YmgE family stress response membrane protein, partial [Sphingomicrobium sp.]|nr:GlsB/YeaQ/YmgE family stress response membrane protein [Sphingomicrobium sp.]
LIFNGGSINSEPLDITNILVSLVGAIVLLGIVNLIRRGSVR